MPATIGALPVTGKLEGKVVIVAGGSAGVGKGVSALFATEGAHVAVLARGGQRLSAAVSEIGHGVVGIVADISSPDSVRAAFAEVDSRFGRLDVVLNVAGAARARRIEDVTDADISTVVGVNFLGPIYTTRAAIPLMRRTGGGDIVNVSSEVTLDDLPYMTLYSSTKRGMDGFTRTMTKELRGDNIRMVLVTLGTVSPTSFGDNLPAADMAAAHPVWQADGYLTRVAGSTPISPEAVAETMLYVVTRPRHEMIDVIHVRAAG
jgi:NAD(P)-dependent dehydrogenase (short-subunit alcohol dehydrogenase family)